MAEEKYYLGRVFDPHKNELTDKPVLMDGRDLTTHGVIVGMTGSGKTGLAVGLIEEAVLSGIPCLVIDPKAEMGNLLLSFPNLAPCRFCSLDRPRRGRAQGQDAGGLCRRHRRGMEEGACRLGDRRGADQAVQGCGRFRRLYPRQHRVRPDQRPQLVSGPAGRDKEGRGGRPRADHRVGLGAAFADRHRGRSHHEPRAHPALEDLGRLLVAGPGPQPGKDHHLHPGPAAAAGWGLRAGGILSPGRADEARGGAQQRRRVARRLPGGARECRWISISFSSPAAISRGCRSSISPTSRTRSGSFS